MKPGVSDASQDEIGTSAQASNAAIDPGAERAQVGGQRLAEGRLDVALAPLLGMASGGRGREPRPLARRRRLDLVVAHRRAGGAAPGPEAEAGARARALPVAQGAHHVVSAAGTRDLALVKAARHGDPADRGAGTTRAATSQARGLPPRSPRGPRLGPAGHAGRLDDQARGRSAARRVFLRGHAGASPARTRASCRCRASPAGGGGLQPSACSRRARSGAWSGPAPATSLTARLRRSAQRAGAQPAFTAPALRTASTPCHGAGLRRAGRPGMAWGCQLARSPWGCRRGRVPWRTAIRLPPSRRARSASER